MIYYVIITIPEYHYVFCINALPQVALRLMLNVCKLGSQDDHLLISFYQFLFGKSSVYFLSSQLGYSSFE